MRSLSLDFNEPGYFLPEHFDDLILQLHFHGASDINLQSGERIIIELNGNLIGVSSKELTYHEISEYINHIYGANASAIVQGGTDLDCSYQISSSQKIYRFRVNITPCLYNNSSGIQVTMRVINSIAPKLKDLHLPSDLLKKLIQPAGLSIISGATGSGKSTLLSSVISNLLRNKEKSSKILSYEAPIEYTYGHIDKVNSLISQVEIPKHIASFELGIRNALRRKPDVIMLGEIRDRETLKAVIEASLTGHPVYTTLHSNGVVDIIRRLINMHSPDEQKLAYYDLITTINTLVWQTLVPAIDGQRVAIREYLTFNQKIRDFLYQQPLDRISYSLHMVLKKYGCPLENDINNLIKNKMLCSTVVKRFNPHILGLDQ